MRSESRESGDPKKGPSWASIVGASSDEDENAGISFIAVTAVVDKVIPAIAGARIITEGWSKVSSAAGKAWKVVVAGSGVRKKGPSRDWVKCLRSGIFPPTRSEVSSGKEGPTMAVKQTGIAVGPIAVLSPSTSDLRCSAPQRPDLAPFGKNMHPEFSILGLGDEDFPPIRPLSDLGKSREALIYVDGSVKTRASSEVKASLNSVPIRSQPVQLGSRTDKRVFVKGKEATAAVLQLDDAKAWGSVVCSRWPLSGVGCCHCSCPR